MSKILKVSLIGAEFFARHGYYPQEQILGNRFVVDIDAQFSASVNMATDEIANTLNYEQLHNIATEQMQLTKQLLETVAHGIADEIMRRFPYILQLSVCVKKLHPPLKGQVGASAVTVIINNAN
ncbi:dihydroneopterin aldolase [Mucilaginibacter lacusdianchii]|uniref:dihydroneopterin aldolase n=1 Tax=Mucilaginibacter lacusdianchii TaxID=2684211 RepID=UPI00131CE3B0|nr:dihydroneopterin aldolase [Mucilaginibacter sp. JXJ CY 39]